MYNKEIQDLFVPHKIAALANKKEFYDECLAFYAGNPLDKEYVWILNIRPNMWHTHRNNTTAIVAPTIDQLIDWFEKKHKIIIETPLDQTSDIKYCIEITKWKDFSDFEKVVIPEDIWGMYRDKREAKIAAIQEAFKLLKDK